MKEEGPKRIGELMGVVPTVAQPPAQGQPARQHPGREVGEKELPALIAALWPHLVGPEIAANTRPLCYRAGRLVVSASSSAWAQTLHLMSEEIRARLDARLGTGRIRRLSFRHAGWDEVPADDVSAPKAPPSPASATPGLPLSAAQREALQAVDDMDLSPDLRARIQAAMRAAFVREEKNSVR